MGVDVAGLRQAIHQDAKCCVHQVWASQPELFRCTGCGGREASSHNERLIEKCQSDGKQYSDLGRTIFEQTVTGLSQCLFKSTPLIFDRFGPFHRAEGFYRSGIAGDMLPSFADRIDDGHHRLRKAKAR